MVEFLSPELARCVTCLSTWRWARSDEPLYSWTYSRSSMGELTKAASTPLGQRLPVPNETLKGGEMRGLRSRWKVQCSLGNGSWYYSLCARLFHNPSMSTGMLTTQKNSRWAVNQAWAQIRAASSSTRRTNSWQSQPAYLTRITPDIVENDTYPLIAGFRCQDFLKTLRLRRIHHQACERKRSRIKMSKSLSFHVVSPKTGNE